jgi:trimeric autotransporter adhesin
MVSTDTFGNLGSSTDFLNTNALGLNSGTTPTDGLGQPTNQSGIPGPSPGPMVNATGATPAPATNPATVGIGGTGAGGAPTGSTGTDWGSLFGNLGSDISSILSSPLGSLVEFTALYKIIADQASATQTQNNALAGQISAIGQPDVTAGKSLLDAYTSGNLTAPFQAQYDAAKAADAKTATSQEQQVASMLANSGGQNMQSAQVSQSGQIEAQKNLADQTAMSNAFLGELSASLSLTSTGGAFVQSGIMQEIQSNTQLQGQLADLMGALAKAYAQQTSNSGKGGSAGGGVGGLIKDVSSIWKGVSNLFSGPADAGALATSAAGIGDISAAPGLAANVSEAGTTAAANVAAMDLSTSAIPSAVSAAAPAAVPATASAAVAPAAASAAAAPIAADAAGAGALATAMSGVGDLAAAPGLAGSMADLAASANAAALAANTGAAAEAGGGAAGAGAGAAGTAVAVAAPIVFAYMLYNAIQEDKQAGTPMAQMSVLASNGPQGKAIADAMIAEASKYGDPTSQATWDKMGAAQAAQLKAMGLSTNPGVALPPNWHGQPMRN